MGLLVDLAYFTALGLASPLILYKALLGSRHVRGMSRRLSFVLPEPGPCVWVHGVSVGEVLAAKSFVKALSAALPGREIVISTSTSTGQDVARKAFPGHRVIYFPIDFSWSVRRYFRRLMPELVVLVEGDLWPNFLERAEKANVPVVVINGRLSERSARRWSLVPQVFRRLFQKVTCFAVQSIDYARRFESVGVRVDRLKVTGLMKYDNLPRPGDINAQGLRERMGIDSTAPVLIAGSTHDPEEGELLAIFKDLREAHPGLRLILAPRHNERSDEIERLILSQGLSCTRYSRLGAATPDSSSVILVDVLGELGRLYGAADLCFVGGSLIPHGGQNMLEPACLAKPVLFGPHVFNFTEIVKDLLGHDAAVQVMDRAELKSVLDRLLTDRNAAEALGRRALETIDARRGATSATVTLVSELLHARESVGHRQKTPRESLAKG